MMFARVRFCFASITAYTLSTGIYLSSEGTRATVSYTPRSHLPQRCPVPCHGYFYRILFAQGPDAPRQSK